MFETIDLNVQEKFLLFFFLEAPTLSLDRFGS